MTLHRPAFSLFASLALAASLAAAERLTLNFNPDWRFIREDPAGAQAAEFNDQAWKVVSAPHTFNDVDTFDNWSILGHVGEQEQWSGRTWYRKTFAAPEAWRGKKIYVEFEGVRQIAEVYLNGQLLGVSKTGFTPFGFDLTPHLKIGASNVLAVMADNRFMKDPVGLRVDRPPAKGDLNVGATANPSLQTMLHGMESGMPEEIADLPADKIPWNNPHWHPAHGGIYRNVRLHVMDPLHVSLPLYSFLQTAGVYAYARDIGADVLHPGQFARVSVEIPVENARKADAKIELQAEVFDADGKSVLTLKHAGGTLKPGAQDSFKLSGFLSNPRLWSTESPHVYRVVCAIRSGGETIDTTEVPLGIRNIRWDAASGLYINDRHVKLHGWGQKPTNEWPGLGAALPDWLHFYTLQLMKDAGGNFVRWGHATAGRAQIEAGDRLGIVALQPGVDGEADTKGAAWKLRVVAFRDAVIYYRNNPSIFIWEGGNQKITREHVQELRAFVDRYDPHGGRAYTHRRPDEVVGEFMDVAVGTEGGNEIPRLPVVEGEYNREESPRRVWDNFSPPNFGYKEALENPNNSYKLNQEEFAVNQISHWIKKLAPDKHGGGANWIFTDSTSGGRVACEVARASGEVDGARLLKEAFYVCAAIYRDDPQVHIVGHWSYPADTKKPVYVASNADEVELFVNGKSLGRAKPKDRYLFTFADVAFAPGEIKAVAYAGGKQVATQSKHTAGPAVGLKLTPITGPGGWLADGTDIALFDVEAIDARGQRVPTFQARVDFALEGAGVWRGGYNSGKINSTNNTFLDLEAGINRVAVRATRTAGKITLRARGEGLAPATVSLESKPFAAENGISATLPAFPAAVLPNAAALPSRSSRVSITGTEKIPAAGSVGQFVKSFSYSGKSGTATVARDAQDGKKIYADRDFAFSKLPAALRGADWISAAQSDAGYSAVDLMEIAVPAGSVVSVAQDDALPRPAWLTSQFKPAELSLNVNGRAMKIFQHRAEKDESLTLGSNFEGSTPANMFVVFVGAGK